MNVSQKKCTTCHEWKPIEEFYRNRQMKDGLTPMCKTCFSEKFRKTKPTKNPIQDFDDNVPELNLFEKETEINPYNNNLKPKIMAKTNPEDMNTEIGSTSNPLTDSELLNQKIEPAGFTETPEERKERAKLEGIKTGILIADALIRSQFEQKNVITAEHAIFEKCAELDSNLKMPPKFLNGMFAHRLGQYATQQSQISALFFGICRELALNYIKEQEIDDSVRERWEKEIDKSSISQEIMNFVKKQLNTEQ